MSIISNEKKLIDWDEYTSSLIVELSFGQKFKFDPRIDVRSNWLIRTLNSILELMFDEFCQICSRLVIYKKIRKYSLSAQFNVERYIVFIINAFSSSNRFHHQIVFIIKSFSSSNSFHHQIVLIIKSFSSSRFHQVILIIKQCSSSSHIIKRS
jgi:hypothetical protein